jgi:hypothetical protein
MTTDKRPPEATTKGPGLLDTRDPDLGAHAALLLSNLSRDVAALQESFDLSAPEGARHAVAVLDDLRRTLELYERAVAALLLLLPGKETGVRRR